MILSNNFKHKSVDILLHSHPFHAVIKMEDKATNGIFFFVLYELYNNSCALVMIIFNFISN